MKVGSGYDHHHRRHLIHVTSTIVHYCFPPVDIRWWREGEERESKAEMRTNALLQKWSSRFLSLGAVRILHDSPCLPACLRSKGAETIHDDQKDDEKKEEEDVI